MQKWGHEVALQESESWFPLGRGLWAPTLELGAGFGFAKMEQAAHVGFVLFLPQGQRTFVGDHILIVWDFAGHQTSVTTAHLCHVAQT